MLKIRKIMGRELSYINGYSRVQFEMDKILLNYDHIEILYNYYDWPGNIVDHFIKRLIKYPRYLKKTDNDEIINHIAVQHLSDLARKLNPNKTIIHLLDIWDFINHHGLRNSSFVNKLRLKGLKNCRHIIAISEFTKQEAIEKLGIEEDRITVIRCGVNREIFHPIKENELHNDYYYFGDKKTILYVGTESGRKDFLTLLYAFRDVKNWKEDVILIRIGRPEYMNKIKKLALENDIKYFTNVSNEFLNVLYNQCDLFIYPSIYEGYGLPGLEANSAGCPMICSDIPVFRELYNESALFFEPRNTRMLADIISENINNDKIKKKLREKGIELAKKNTWEKYANQYLEYLIDRGIVKRREMIDLKLKLR